MKLLKKNQVIIYVIALMLVVAGYLNFTASDDMKSAVQTSSTEEELAKMANIGDAQLVSSNVVVEEDIKEETKENTVNNVVNNTVNNKNNEETIYTNSENIKDDKGNDEYFSKSKLERDKMYSQMLETYEKVLNSSNSLETQRQSATEEIKRINNTKNSIMICENLILIKGFDNCVIFVNGASISVIVEDDELSVEEVAKIQNVISREMNAQIENIHIQSK